VSSSHRQKRSKSVWNTEDDDAVDERIFDDDISEPLATESEFTAKSSVALLPEEHIPAMSLNIYIGLDVEYDPVTERYTLPTLSRAKSGQLQKSVNKSKEEDKFFK